MKPASVTRAARRLRAVAGVLLLFWASTAQAADPLMSLPEGGKPASEAPPPATQSVPAPCCTPPLDGALGVLAGSCGSCPSSGCGEANCGRGPCVDCEGMGPVRRALCGIQNAVLCPDPCFQSKWVPAANAGLFVDQARPTTMTRLRWDSGVNLRTPDRSAYFMGANAFPGAPVPNRVNYNELHLYQEIAIDKFALFFDLPYRNLDTDNRGGGGGIGDLAFGTKTMFLDSELLTLTFQFRVKVPTAGPGTGVGAGSPSLEPALLSTAKLYTDTYWQSQTGYWFAVGNGTGSLFSTRHSLNTVLWQPLPDTALIVSFEAGLYTFTSGSFRDPATGLASGRNGDTFFTLGPGFRLAFGDRLDAGFGMQFATTNGPLAGQLYRTELRWRF